LLVWGLLFGTSSLAIAAPITVTGSLTNVQGTPLSGTVSVFREVPHFQVTHHEVTEKGTFEFKTDSQGGLILHVSSEGYPSDEVQIQAGSAGAQVVNFVLPLGQTITGKVIDGNGRAVVGADVQVRYHEPEKPRRHVLLDFGYQTDGSGEFQINGVGVDISFFIDVHSPLHFPTTSKKITLRLGETKVDDIILSEPVAVVIIKVVDKLGEPISGAEVSVVADSSGMPAAAGESWILHEAFQKHGYTSSQGNLRFSGVPPGRILVVAKTLQGTVEQSSTAQALQELRITLRIP